MMRTKMSLRQYVLKIYDVACIHKCVFKFKFNHYWLGHHLLSDDPTVAYKQIIAKVGE